MMNDKYNLPLDPVYTSKLMWAVIAEAERGAFERGQTLLVLHTGGLQGKL
jgi:1-aminocyclopropane-1-carboxylate deaminase